MNVIYEEIKSAVAKELTAANEKHPMFADLHHGIGVIFEEVDETRHELYNLNKFLVYAWKHVKADNTKLACNHLLRMKDAAISLAIEACQVAAMCEKAVESEKSRAEKDENELQLLRKFSGD